MSKSPKQTRVNIPRTGAGAAFTAAGGLDHPGTRRAVQRLRAFAAAVELTRSDSAEQRRACRKLGRAVQRSLDAVAAEARRMGQFLPDRPTIEDWEALLNAKQLDASKRTLNDILRLLRVWDADRRREAVLRAEAAGSARREDGVPRPRINGDHEAQPLHVDDGARLAFWREKRLGINSHADFDVLALLWSARGNIVLYADLLRKLKPDQLAASIQQLSDAPPEIKAAVTHIRRELKNAECPLRIESVRSQGYRLLSRNE